MSFMKTFVMVGAVFAALPVTAMAGVGTPHDLKIGKAAASVGDGVYDADGSEQTVTEKADVGDSADWGVELENSGGTLQFIVDGCTSTNKFKVKYYELFLGGRNNVTQAVSEGEYGPILDNGGVAQLDVVIRPKDNAKRGDTFDCPISVDLDPPIGADTVVARLKVT